MGEQNKWASFKAWKPAWRLRYEEFHLPYWCQRIFPSEGSSDPFPLPLSGMAFRRFRCVPSSAEKISTIGKWNTLQNIYSWGLKCSLVPIFSVVFACLFFFFICLSFEERIWFLPFFYSQAVLWGKLGWEIATVTESLTQRRGWVEIWYMQNSQLPCSILEATLSLPDSWGNSALFLIMQRWYFWLAAGRVAASASKMC